MKIQADWTGEDLRFQSSDSKGHSVLIDGNSVQASSPMTMILHAMAGCTGSDVVSLLEKMRQNFSGLKVEITGEKRSEGDYPRPWERIHLLYIVKGNADPAMVEKAIRLSQEKYCSVSAMLGKTAEISWDYKIEG